MAKIDSVLFDARALEALAGQNTPVHNLDPRTKLSVTLFFILAVVSNDKYAVASLLPFFIFPVTIATLGNIPIRYLARKLLLVSPFAVFIGLANPFLDKEVLFNIGSIPVSGGAASFFSIILRFLLTVSSCLLLIATTGLNGTCLALERLKIPRIFIVQLLFLYRYIYVLIEESARLIRARNLRSFHGKGQELATAGPIIGHLLLRTIDRARRIHLAMLCRGFAGEIRIARNLQLHATDWLFMTGWIAAFILLRFINLSQILGNIFTRILTP